MSTRMISHCRGLFSLGAMRAFFKSPRIIVLPREEEAAKKVEHGKDIKSFSSSETIQKGAFEHETNPREKHVADPT